MADEELEWTLEGLQKAVEEGFACTYVSKFWTQYETFNFFNFKYCTVPDNLLGTLFFVGVAVVLTVVAFFLLGDIAETYLSPVLTKIANYFQLSETISGVTLLAFANGAPDIISSFSAGGEEDGIYIAIGNLFGACLFSITLVIGRWIMVSKKVIQMDNSWWIRDLLFYVFTALVLLTYGLIGHLNIWMALSFFGIYIVYFSVVLIQHMNSKKDSIDAEDFKDHKDQDKEILHERMRNMMKGESISVSGPNDRGSENMNASIMGGATSVYLPGEGNEKVEDINQNIEQDSNDSLLLKTPNTGREHSLTLTITEVKAIYNDEVQNIQNEEKPGLIGKLIDIFSIPFKFL